MAVAPQKKSYQRSTSQPSALQEVKKSKPWLCPFCLGPSKPSSLNRSRQSIHSQQQVIRHGIVASFDDRNWFDFASVFAGVALSRGCAGRSCAALNEDSRTLKYFEPSGLECRERSLLVSFSIRIRMLIFCLVKSCLGLLFVQAKPMESMKIVPVISTPFLIACPNANKRPPC